MGQIPINAERINALATELFDLLPFGCGAVVMIPKRVLYVQGKKARGGEIHIHKPQATAVISHGGAAPVPNNPTNN